MCGVGKRFKEAGYRDHKSMIKINNLNMLERIMNNFKDIHIDIYLITSEKIVESLACSKEWEFIKSKLNLILIKDHLLGPAYSLYKAFSQIPKGFGTFISYCDITWQWDKDMQIDKETDAAIYCHYGFHPHLVRDSFSAFCKPSDSNKMKLEEIKEKESYTNTWMNEPLSIGLFFIKDFLMINKSLEKMIKDNNTVTNEFFPSLIFNYLIAEEIEVELIPVESFVHYGTPSQLEDVNTWCKYFFAEKKDLINLTKLSLYPATIYTSGKGSRMKVISKKPKALIEVGKRKMLELVYEALPLNKKKLSIVFNDLDIPIDNLPKETKYIEIQNTNSQYESLYNSVDHIFNQKNFYLCSCDCFGFFDNQLLQDLIKKDIFDIICFGFIPSLMQEKLESSFTTFSAKSFHVEKIFVKEFNEYSDFGLAGFFWIRDGSLFTKYIRKYKDIISHKDGELIIDDVLEFCLQKGLNLGYLPLKKYIHLGTEEEFKEYIYWEKNINSLMKY